VQNTRPVRGTFDMARPSMQAVRAGLGFLAFACAFALSGCGGDNGDNVRIAETDGTPPIVELQVDPEFGANIGVSSGGPNQTTTISRRTGKISLEASAKDSESGIRRLEIWLSTTTTICLPDQLCKQRIEDPGQPLFEVDFGQKNPGDSTPRTDHLLRELEVEPYLGASPPPPGGTRSVKFEFHATATNHLAGKASTSFAFVTFSGPWQSP
jgi:hypothetical protein